MTDPIEAVARAVAKAKALLDRHDATTGYFKWTAHNPPPAMEDMADAMRELLAMIDALRAELLPPPGDGG